METNASELSMDRPAHGLVATTVGHRSFERFYTEARDPVFRAVLLATRDRPRAEDAVQETFTRAYRDWERIRDHPNQRAWVVRVALNSHRSMWRRLWREAAVPPPDVAAAPTEDRFDEALIGRVWSVPRRQREVVALRILLDQSTEQTSAALGIAPGTVTAHLHRALTSLRRGLEEIGPLEERP
jgi:RNA polymerase sigma factor (sigma-70 family)